MSDTTPGLVNEAAWILTVRALPGGPPPEVRIRQLLKTLLRQFHLRCVDVQVASPQSRKPAPAAWGR